MKLNFDKKNFFLIGLLLLLGLSPLLWFQNKMLIMGGDFVIPLNPRSIFFQELPLWFSHLNAGFPSYFLTFTFPFNLFWAFLDSIGFSLITIEKLWFVFLFILPGLAMYYLLSVLFLEKKIFIPRLIASIFYMFNPVVLAVNPPIFTSYLAVGITPLLLGLLIRGLEKKEEQNRYVFLFGLTSFLTIPIAANPPMFAVVWLVLIGYLFFHFIFIFKKRIQTIFFSIKVFGVFLLLNAWWLIGFISSLGGAQLSTAKVGEWMDWTTVNASFLNIFRLIGSWAWTSSAFGSPYASYADLYSHPLFVLATFIVPILAFSALFFKRRKKNLFFFFLLLFLAIFLAKGSHTPLGLVNKWLFFNAPYFWLFRGPWEKFSFIVGLAYSVLSCFAISEILEYLRKKRSKIKLLASDIFIPLILVGIFIAAYPIFSGDIIRGNPTIGYLPGQKVSLPSYWFEMSDRVKKQKIDSRLLLSPMNPGLYIHYEWGYQGVDPAVRLLSAPLVIAGNGSYIIRQNTQGFISVIYKDLLQDPPGNLIKIASLFNINSILQRNDFDWKNFGSFNGGSPEYIKGKLAEEGIGLKETFGKLDYYALENKYFLPHFYTPKNVIISSQDLNALLEIVSQPDYDVRSAIYFNDQKTISDILFRDRSIFYNSNESAKENISNLPVVEFKKIDPTKYRIIIHGAKDNFPLIFSESFHSSWKAYIAKNYKVSKAESNDLAGYKILDGNLDNQAAADELKIFIENGEITTLGDLKEKNIKHTKWENNKEVFDYNEKYKIGFVSKDFQGTIQNDNLPNGNFWDTWPEKPLSEKSHIVANGYANSWLIEPDKICAENKKACVKNADGGYDFEMIVEFWPQRLLYIGLFISGVALLACFVCFIYIWIRKKKQEKENKNI